jgi:uncharacterized protein YkvS
MNFAALLEGPLQRRKMSKAGDNVHWRKVKWLQLEKLRRESITVDFSMMANFRNSPF